MRSSDIRWSSPGRPRWWPSTVHAIPLLVKSARAAFESVDRVYEKAARNLGASEWRVFWRVTLPLARRSIFAAAVLAFARSLGDFGATLMIAGNIPDQTQTAAVAIYDAVESGNTLLARVLVLVISVVAMADRVRRQPAGAQAGARMIQARIAKRFPAGPDSAGFSLDIEFQAGAGVTVLFGPSGVRQDAHARFHRRLRAARMPAASCWTTRSCSTAPPASTCRRGGATAVTCSRTTRCSRT